MFQTLARNRQVAYRYVLMVIAIIVCLSMGHTWLISAWLMFAIAQQSRRISELALTDALTGAYNRRHL